MTQAGCPRTARASGNLGLHLVDLRSLPGAALAHAGHVRDRRVSVEAPGGLLIALLSPPHAANVSFFRQQCRKGLAMEPDVLEA
jgi:hypothetical protein